MQNSKIVFKKVDLIMTQEDKELLLKDLCARLPYGVKFNYGGYDGCDYKVEIITSTFINDFPIEECRLYLRPMSSMTEEEKNELTEMTITSPNLETTAVLFRERHYEEEPHWRNDWTICSLPKVLNWLNSHHFDYRGLIPKGLAIEVTEENNPYKE